MPPRRAIGSEIEDLASVEQVRGHSRHQGLTAMSGRRDASCRVDRSAEVASRLFLCLPGVQPDP